MYIYIYIYIYRYIYIVSLSPCIFLSSSLSHTQKQDRGVLVMKPNSFLALSHSLSLSRSLTQIRPPSVSFCLSLSLSFSLSLTHAKPGSRWSPSEIPTAWRTRILLHIWMSHCHMYQWVMLHTWTCCVTQVKEIRTIFRFTHVKKLCHRHGWVMSHTWISCVTHMNEIRTSIRVTHMNKSC